MKADNDPARRFASAIRRSLSAAASYDGHDEDEAWALTLSVLAALYGAEELERTLDEGYYEHRDASPNGRVLGGLMWCRNDVQHAGGDVRRLHWSQAEAYVRHQGEWVRAQPYVRREGEWIPAQTMVNGWTWPRRDELPSDGKGRHAMYDERVAERRWLEPMRDAASYLLDERHD